MVEISICIPVFGTERYLRDCLKSIADQSFSDYEVVIVNDGSPGTDENGLKCKKIVKECKKKYKLPINYIEHSKNRGVLEARRTAVEEAKGQYILNLDSDDSLTPNALELLYSTAKNTGADIVHGITKTYFSDKAETQIDEDDDKILKRQERVQNNVAHICHDVLTNREIFDGFLIENNHCGFLCAKLLKKEVYLEAFNHIPPMFCIMGDDFLQYFWISYFSKKYVSITDEIYRYNINTGISSHRIIKDLVIWSHVCSASSIFTALYSELEDFDISLTKEESSCIDKICFGYVYNNLKQLNSVVVPEIKDDAYKLLCDFWGKDLVEQTKKSISIQ